MAKAVGVLLAAALILLSISGPCAASELEGLDDPEMQQRAVAAEFARQSAAGSVDAGSAGIDEVATAAAAAARKLEKAQEAAAKRHAALLEAQKIGPVEACILAVILLYVANIMRGRKVNMSIANAWAKEYAAPGGIFDKQFSLVGAGDSQETLMKDAANVFKLYASGRRHCQGLLATLQLVPRQDALALLWSLISPSEDTVCIEAYMNETSMPPIVLAVGTAKATRAMQAECKDISTFTRQITPLKADFPAWPASKLTILGEHSAIFGELFNEARVHAVLNTASPALKYFRALHFTSENTEGSCRRLLRFTFALPPAGRMADIAPLIALVPLFIDLVGTYRLSPDLKEKAMKQRAKEEEREKSEEEARKRRQEALLQKKAQAAMEEKARMARMDPITRQKYEDKQREKMIKKQMNKRLVKIG